MDINFELFSGLPIHIDGVGMLHQPTVGELLKHQLNVDDIVSIFFISLDVLEIDGEVKDKLKTFDLFFMPGEGDESLVLMDRLIDSLTFLMKANSIDLDLPNFCLRTHGGCIDRDNFDELSNAVLKMFGSKRPKHTPRRDMSERQRAIYEKTMEGRRRQHEKNKPKMSDVVRQLAVGSGSVIRYKDILEMTYWEFINLYESIVIKNNYDEFIKYKSGGQFEIKQDVEHWMNQLKVDDT